MISPGATFNKTKKGSMEYSIGQDLLMLRRLILGQLFPDQMLRDIICVMDCAIRELANYQGRVLLGLSTARLRDAWSVSVVRPKGMGPVKQVATHFESTW